MDKLALDIYIGDIAWAIAYRCKDVINSKTPIYTIDWVIVTALNNSLET